MSMSEDHLIKLEAQALAEAGAETSAEPEGEGVRVEEAEPVEEEEEVLLEEEEEVPVPDKFKRKSKAEILASEREHKQRLTQIQQELAQKERELVDLRAAQDQVSTTAAISAKEGARQQKIQEVATEKYQELLVAGAEEYSQESPRTWQLAVQYADKAVREKEDLEQRYSELQTIMDSTMVPMLVERRASMLIQPDEDVKANEILQSLLEDLPVPLAEFNRLDEALQKSLLTMAKKGAKLKKIEARAKSSGRVPPMVATEVLTRDTARDSVRKVATSREQELANVWKERIAGYNLTDEDYLEMARMHIQQEAGGG